MRLFVLWSGMDLARSVVSGLKAAGHEVVYWVGNKNGYSNDFPEIIFHDHFDAWNGKPAPALSDTEFEPASPELISRFHKTESIILTMMNKRFDWMGTDERKHFYYEMLSYWSGVLKKYRPEAVIFDTVPHTVYDYLLYELARSENIRTVMFRGTLPVTGRLLLYEDFREGSLSLKTRAEENKNRKFSINDLSDEWREFYEKQTSPKYDSTPRYLQENRKRFSFFNRILLKTKAVQASAKNGTLFEQVLFRIIKSLKENIRDEHKRVESAPDYSQKFVYMPLHYQPESTTSALGDIFVDQILALKTLSASLPENWALYVKEHPTQWFKRGLNFAGSRYRGYYEKISKIKNVFLVPIDTDTYSLIHKAQAVATISGVPGSEALLRQKPVLLFGYPWYQHFPGVFKVENVETCRKALKKIEGGLSVNPQDTINFLKSVDETALRGYIDEYQQQTSKVSKEETLKNILSAISSVLGKK